MKTFITTLLLSISSVIYAQNQNTDGFKLPEVGYFKKSRCNVSLLRLSNGLFYNNTSNEKPSKYSVDVYFGLHTFNFWVYDGKECVYASVMKNPTFKLNPKKSDQWIKHYDLVVTLKDTEGFAMFGVVGERMLSASFNYTDGKNDIIFDFENE